MSLKISERTARKLQSLLDQKRAGGGGPVDAGYRESGGGPQVLRNVSNTEIPDYACVQPVTTALRDNRIVVDVQPWDGQYTGPFLFTSHGKIAPDQRGLAQSDTIVRVLYDTAFTPDVGASAGPTVGMKIAAGIGCGTCLGAYDTDRKIALVILAPIASGICFIKAPSGGIPGRAGTLLGEATCDVWSTGATTRTISDTGANISVVNWSVNSACVNGDRYGIAGYWAGKWWIISEDCANTAPGNNQSGTTSTIGSVVANPVGTPQSGSSFTIGRPETPAWAAPFEVAATPSPLEVE